MNTFKITLFDGHPIIKDGDNIILIDTGAPSTIHSSEQLVFCSNRYTCSSNYMGLTIDKLSELLGTKITTLLGTDILSSYNLMLDYKNCIAQFDKNEIVLEGKEHELRSFMGIPKLKLNVDNQDLNFFLDTGAKLSYLANSYTANYASTGKQEDFHPGVGKFQTECFDIPTSLGNISFNVRYGNLPTLLQRTLMMGGTNGIMGSDFFNHFKVVINFKNNRLKYAKHTD
jgi:hypothetical protein